MPAVSAGDLTLLRAEEHRSVHYLSVLVPDTLWSAQINNAGAAQGDTSIPFDGGSGSSFSTIEALQEVWVGSSAGDDDIGRLRIRSISSGDSGVTGTLTAAEHGLVLADDQYLTFKHDYPVKPLFPKIETNGDFRKDRDIAYGSNYNDQPDPVCIGGDHRADFIDDTLGYWQANVDLTNSYAMAQGATISSYAVAVTPTTGVTISVTAGVGYIRFATAGRFWVKFTTTDSNGKTQDTYRFYYAHSTDPTNAHYPITDFEVTSLSGDWNRGGWDGTIILRSSVPITSVPEKTLVILWQQSWYGTTQKRITFLPDNSSSVLVGYTRRESIEKDLATGVGNVSIRIVTINEVLNLYNFSIALESIATSPTKWYEYASWLTVGRIIHHILDWHSTVLEVCDVIGLADNTDGRAFGDVEGGAIYSVIDTLAREAGIRAHVVSDKGGRLHLTQDPQLLPDTPRGALTTVQDITTSDRGGPITIIQDPNNRTALARVSGFEFPGTYTDGVPDVSPYCAQAPGTVPADEGVNFVSLDRQVFTSQAHANQIAGRLFARENNPYPEARISFQGNYVGVLEVALDEFWTLSLLSTETPREIVWSTQKLLCRSVRATWENGALTVEAVFEPEAAGFDGVQTDCLGFPTLGGETIDPPTTSTEEGVLLSASSVEAFSPITSTWTEKTSEATQDMIADPFWQTQQASTASADAIVWRCGTGFIKRSTDGGDTWSTITPSGSPTNDAGDSPAPTWAAMEFVELVASWGTQQTFLAIGRWQNTSSVWRSWLLKTTDDGANWTDVQVTTGAAAGTTINSNEYIGDSGSPTPTGLSVGNVAVLSTTNAIGLMSRDRIVVLYSIDGAYTLTKEDDIVITDDKRGGASSMRALSSSQAIWVYVSATDAGKGDAIIWETLDGVNLTQKDQTQFETNTTVLECRVAKVTSTKILVVYRMGSPATDEVYMLHGTIIGSAVSWETRQLIASAAYNQISLEYLGNDKAVVAYHYDDGGGNDIYARVIDTSGTNPTVGSATELVASVTATWQVTREPDRHLIRYDDTTAIFTYEKGSDGILAFTISGNSISVVGTPVAYKTDENGGIALVGTRIAQISIFNGGDFNFFTLSGTTLTFESTGSAGASAEMGACIEGLDTDTFFYFTVNRDGENTVHGRTVTATSGSEDMKISGVDVTRVTGATAWVTVLEAEATIRLLAYTISSMARASNISMGAATLAQFDAKTYWAHPVTPWNSETAVHVYGRMQNPQSLGDPAHIIKSTDSGSSWSAVETGWGSDYCASLAIDFADGLIAIRSNSTSSKIYIGAAPVVASTLPYAKATNPHGMYYDWLYGTVCAASAASNSIMVAKSLWPYLVWTDITYDHPTGNGVNALVLL